MQSINVEASEGGEGEFCDGWNLRMDRSLAKFRDLCGSEGEGRVGEEEERRSRHQ